MSDLTVNLGSGILAVSLGELVRDARVLAGWTQAGLAGRAGTNQTEVSRIERGVATPLDLNSVEAVLGALGFTASLQVEGRHLADRRRQREPVHARMLGFQATCLERRGFRTSFEVQVGEPVPRGWIDLLAYRPEDRALIVDETKGDLPDVGAFQRSLAFYERNAREVANRLSWNPTRVVILGTLLDSATIAARLAENRELIGHAFPSPVDRLLRWIEDPGHRRRSAGPWRPVIRRAGHRRGCARRPSDRGACRSPTPTTPMPRSACDARLADGGDGGTPRRERRRDDDLRGPSRLRLAGSTTTRSSPPARAWLRVELCSVVADPSRWRLGLTRQRRSRLSPWVATSRRSAPARPPSPRQTPAPARPGR